MNRETCSNCGSDNTEFVQFASGDEEVVDTTAEEVGNDILELRSCLDCHGGIENILTLDSQHVREYNGQ